MSDPGPPTAPPSGDPGTTQPRRPWGRTVHVLLALLLGAGGAAAALALVPTPEQQVGPATISISAALGRGTTVVRIPPFGSISARTHGAPVLLTATLTEVNAPELAHGLASEASRATLVKQMASGLRQAGKRVATRLVIAGLVIGGMIAGFLPGRHLRGVLVGATGGLVAVSILLFATTRQYKVAAFQEASFTGTLERAPDLLEAVQRQGTSIEEIRSKYQIAAERLAEIVALAASPGENPRTGTVALLHVSDIHSNPLGVEFAKRLAETFGVDAVVDTGDLTSFGQPIEGRIGQLLSGVGRPWLFVPGNHDSAEVKASLAQVPNVGVLDKQVAKIGDLSILGWADPTFTPGTGLSNEEARRAQLAESPAVAQRAAETAPDVLAVHNANLAIAANGKVPLVLAGHRHERGEHTVRGTLTLEVGSTGATGLGSFLVRSELAYEAEIVYFRDRRAVAVDYIRLRSLGNDFEVQRHTLQKEPDAGASPGVTPGRSPATSPAPPRPASPAPSPSPAGG